MRIEFGGTGLFVPKRLAHHEERRTVRNRKAGEAMPQVMDPYVCKVWPLADWLLSCGSAITSQRGGSDAHCSPDLL